jgi:hypothetical protein
MSERWAPEREGVVFTVLTARVSLGSSYVVWKALVDDPAEPRRIQSTQVNASDDRSTAGLDKLTYQLSRRFAPDRLDMLETCGLNSVLKPGAYIGKVDIAEYDPSKTLGPQRTELRSQPPIHIRPTGADRSEVNPGGVCLRLNHVHAGGMKPHSTRDGIMEVDQPRYVHASRGRALQCERTVFASGPHQGVPGVHLFRAEIVSRVRYELGCR